MGPEASVQCRRAAVTLGKSSGIIKLSSPSAGTAASTKDLMPTGPCPCTTAPLLSRSAGAAPGLSAFFPRGVLLQGDAGEGGASRVSVYVVDGRRVWGMATHKRSLMPICSGRGIQKSWCWC